MLAFPVSSVMISSTQSRWKLVSGRAFAGLRGSTGPFRENRMPSVSGNKQWLASQHLIAAARWRLLEEAEQNTGALACKTPIIKAIWLADPATVFWGTLFFLLLLFLLHHLYSLLGMTFLWWTHICVCMFSQHTPVCARTESTFPVQQPREMAEGPLLPRSCVLEVGTFLSNMLIQSTFLIAWLPKSKTLKGSFRISF